MFNPRLPQLLQVKDTNHRIVLSLKHAFLLGDDLEQAICTAQHAANIDSALAAWLRGLLLLQEPQFAAVLMPLIAQRFEAYINHLRSHSPWMH